MDQQNKMGKDDIDIVNRWRSLESSKGKRSNLSMRHHYADVAVILQPFLRYTKAM